MYIYYSLLHMRSIMYKDDIKTNEWPVYWVNLLKSAIIDKHFHEVGHVMGKISFYPGMRHVTQHKMLLKMEMVRQFVAVKDQQGLEA